MSFTEEEVLKALKEVDGDKSLGLDGFSLKFEQSFWDVFKRGLLGLFQCFYDHAELDHRFSESFIALILKMKGSASLNNFKPISLWGGFTSWWLMPLLQNFDQ